MGFGSELATRIVLDPLNGTIMGLQSLIAVHSLAEIPLIMGEHPGLAVLDVFFAGMFSVLAKKRYERTNPVFDSYNDTKEFIKENGWKEDAMGVVYNLHPQAVKYASIDMKFGKEYENLLERVREER